MAIAACCVGWPNAKRVPGWVRGAVVWVLGQVGVRRVGGGVNLEGI